MAKLIRDPQLDELVRELNVGDRPAATAAASVVSEGNELEKFLVEMAQRNASDLHIVAGSPPIYRVDGALTKADRPELSAEDVHSLLLSLVSSQTMERLNAGDAVDFSIRLSRAVSDNDHRAWRFRVNVHRQRGTMAAAIRALPTVVPSIADLQLPASLAELVK